MEPGVIHMAPLLVVTEEGASIHAMPPLGHEFRLAKVAVNYDTNYDTNDAKQI